MDLLALVEEATVSAVLDEVTTGSVVDGPIGSVDAGKGSLEIAVGGEGVLNLGGIWNPHPNRDLVSAIVLPIVRYACM